MSVTTPNERAAGSGRKRTGSVSVVTGANSGVGDFAPRRRFAGRASAPRNDSGRYTNAATNTAAMPTVHHRTRVRASSVVHGNPSH